MSGLRGKLTIQEPRRSKRLERSLPDAAAPPSARRTKRAKHEASDDHAARAARSPHPERDPEEHVTEAPPPAPPPKREGSGRIVAPRVRYALRNRLVPDTSKPKPHLPARHEKIISPQFCLFREEFKRNRSSWQTPMCARVGLEHYNSMNQGDEHELVKAVSSNAIVFNGIWFHANFLAKRKGATTCVDLVPKYFFAELESRRSGHFCVSCVKLEPGDPKNIGGCRLCAEEMMHPAGGGYHGAQSRTVRHAPGGLQISFKF